MSERSGVALRARDGEAHCPYCRQRFRTAEPLLACEVCQVQYHQDCLRVELGRCATLGCAGGRVPSDARVLGATGDEPSSTVRGAGSTVAMVLALGLAAWSADMTARMLLGAWPTTLPCTTAPVAVGLFVLARWLRRGRTPSRTESVASK